MWQSQLDHQRWVPGATLRGAEDLVTTGTEPPLSRAHGEVFMGWSGELALLRVGMSEGGPRLCWAMGGRPQVRERGVLHSVSQYYAPHSGAGSAPGTPSSCDVLGGRRVYRPPCKPTATLGHFRYGNGELEAQAVIQEAHPEEVAFYSLSCLLSVYLGPATNPCPPGAHILTSGTDKKGVNM